MAHQGRGEYDEAARKMEAAPRAGGVATEFADCFGGCGRLPRSDIRRFCACTYSMAA